MFKLYITRKNLQAFTLAEVLITLTIIGVVAAMTIPGLNNNINKQDTVAKVKKAYSILSQATESIKADCGGDIQNCVTYSPTDNDGTSRLEVANLYKQKLLLNKFCSGSISGCFYNGQYKYFKGNSSIFGSLEIVTFCQDSKFVLNDGNSVCFDWDGYSTSHLYNIFVDINGTKAPNQLGYDLFIFYYDSPSRTIKANNEDDCTTYGLGTGCALNILRNGEINYY